MENTPNKENQNEKKKSNIILLCLVIIFLLSFLQTYCPIKAFTIILLITNSYLRLILTSWPSIILILGLVLFLKYDDAIGYFIKFRLRAITPGGITAGDVPTEQEKSSVEELKKEVTTTEGVSTTPENELTKVKFFERLYSFIFGSQLEILVKVNSIPSGITTAEAIQFYLDALVKYPQNKSYKFQDYVKFMTNNAGIVRIDGDISNGRLFITDRGKEFLIYLTKEGLSFDKPF